MSKRKTFKVSQSIANGISQILDSVDEHEGTMNFEAIALDRIILDQDNPRELIISFEDIDVGIKKTDLDYSKKKSEIDEITSLSDSIKNHGQINPIVVYKKEDKYIVIAGERRCLASKLAGKKTIKANILMKRPSPFHISMLQWNENNERQDLSLIERLNNLQTLVDCYIKEDNKVTQEMTPTLIKQIIHCSLPLAMSYHSVLTSSENLRKAIEDGKINSLKKASVIAGIASSGLQKEAIQKCMQGCTFNDLKSIASMEKKKQKRMKTDAKTSKRGRITTRVNFGVSKSKVVAKKIIQTLLTSNDFAKYQNMFDKVEWDDYDSLSKTFCQLVRLIEQE